MDSGRCRSCGRAFTAGEIVGRGILRTRPADRGGPVIEFACPACGTVIPLVPYGNGRYALPGQPPPPPPTDLERKLPWDVPGGSRAPGGGTTGPASDRPTDLPPLGRIPPVEHADRPGGRATRRPSDEDPVRPPGPGPDRRLTTLEAFALLGLSPAAVPADVEKAFHERALLCHPDKVAHLDAEFAELANRKFRRLAEARDLLVLVLDHHTDPKAGPPGEPKRG